MATLEEQLRARRLDPSGARSTVFPTGAPQVPQGILNPGTQPMQAVRSVIERPASTVNPELRSAFAGRPAMDPAVSQRLYGPQIGPPSPSAAPVPGNYPDGVRAARPQLGGPAVWNQGGPRSPIQPPPTTGAGATPGTNPGASLAAQSPTGNLVEKAARQARSFGNTAKDMGMAAAGKATDVAGKVASGVGKAAGTMGPLAKMGASAAGGLQAVAGGAQMVAGRDWVDTTEGALRASGGLALARGPFMGVAGIPATVYGAGVTGALTAADYFGKTEQAKNAIRQVLGMPIPGAQAAQAPQPQNPLVEQIPRERTAVNMPSFANVQAGHSSTTDKPVAAARAPAARAPGPNTKAAAKAQPKDTAGLDALIAQQSAKYPMGAEAAPADPGTLDQAGQAPEGQAISLYGYGGNPTGEPVQQFQAYELPPMQGDVPAGDVQVLRGTSKTVASGPGMVEKIDGMPELTSMDTPSLAKFVMDAAATGNPGAMKAAAAALDVILGREGIQQRDVASQRGLQGDQARAGATMGAATVGAEADRYKADKWVEAARERTDVPLKVTRMVKDALGNEQKVDMWIDRTTGLPIGGPDQAGGAQSAPPPGNQKQPVRLTPAQVEAERQVARKALGASYTDELFLSTMKQRGYAW